MKQVQRNEADFSEVFEFAETHYGVDWNRANDMFFNNSLTYKSYDDFYLGDIDSYFNQDTAFENLSESHKGYYIIKQFMIANNVTDCRIDNT